MRGYLSQKYNMALKMVLKRFAARWKMPITLGEKGRPRKISV